MSALEVAAQETAGSPAVADGTEAAIAEALATSNLNMSLRYGADGRWFVWNGRTWAATQDKVPHVLMVAIRRAIVIGLETRTVDAKSIPRLESANGMRGIASLLSAWPNMRMNTEIDPPRLLATPACVIDLVTGERLKHDPSRPITRATAVDIASDDDLWPLVENHLRDCLGLNYNAVHRFLGSALLGLGADRRLVWLHGPGGDGKSTLAKLLRVCLGDYVATVPAEVFQQSSRGAHLHELGSGMAGARLAIALEVGGSLDWARLKGISGGDEQVSKRLYGKAYTYERPPHLLLIANDEPTPPDQASAERVIVGRMTPPTEPDERLMEALKAPSPARDRLAGACLGWLVDGCADFLAEGLGPHQTCARDPAGLEAWWSSAVADGRIVPGRGFTPLDTFAADLRTWLPAGEDAPAPNAMAAFLRSKVRWKRTMTGRGYIAEVRHDAP